MAIAKEIINFKKGFKITEVGMIPEDWNLKELAELTTLLTNGFVGKATSFYTEDNNGITYIQGFNVKENSYNFTGIKKVTLAFHKAHSKSNLIEGDLLTIQTGEIGLTTIVPKELEGSNCHALIISRFNKNLDPKYFSYYFNSFTGRMRFRGIETGTTMKHLNVGDLRTWLVPFPSTKQEQTAIAAALSDVDALIASLDKLIAKKRDIKQATMQQLLTGKVPLPGFIEGLAPINKKWTIYSLGDIATKVGSGITPTGGEKVYKKEGHPFIRSQNVGWGYLLLDDIAFIDEEIHNSFLGTEIKQNDVLLNITGASIGRSAIANTRLVGGNVNQHVCIIRTDKSKLNPYYLNLFLLSKNGQKQIESFQAGGNRQGLNFEQIKSFQIPIPSVIEQQAIVTIISDMDAEIVALEQRRHKTRMLKQGMMQELLTGRIKLV